MNYYAYKAMFASDELVKLQKHMAIALRRKDAKLAEKLMFEHDLLVKELQNWNRQATARRGL